MRKGEWKEVKNRSGSQGPSPAFHRAFCAARPTLPLPLPLLLHRYKIEVYTSDVRGAGTDANVRMVLYGTKGDTGERELANSKNNFERAQARGERGE